MSARGEIREQRRVVTALSADLVGSTPIAEQLDPEEARIVVGEAVARMVHAVEEFGGTVKDLAGDGVCPGGDTGLERCQGIFGRESRGAPVANAARHRQ